MKKIISILISVVMVMSIFSYVSAVKAVAVKSVKLDKTAISLKVGQAYSLKVTLSPANTTQKLLVYSTSDKNIAVVDAKGKITARKAGKVTINVVSSSNKNIKAACVVTVATRPVKEFTVYAFGGLPWNHEGEMNDPIGKALTAATGVKFKAEQPVGDWNEALALMISSDDLPDLVLHTGNSLTQLVDAGALQPLKAKIMKSPNLVSLYGDEIGHLAYSSADPEFYSFGSGPRPSSYYAWEFAEFAFWMQIDAVKKAGYPKIKSIQEYENVLSNYVKANPTINGAKTIGFTFAIQDGWRWLFSLIGGINNSAGNPSDGKWYVNPNTNKVTALVRRPEAKKYIQWLNHMFAIGLLDNETFTQDFAQAQAKVANGRVVGFADAWWQFYDAIYALAQKSPERDYFPFQARFDPANTKWRDQQNHGTLEGNGYSITTAVSAEDTQLIVNFFDYNASDEGQKLLSWGLEGVNYTFDQKDTSKAWVAPKNLYVGNTPSQRRVDPVVWGMRTSTTDVADIRSKTGLAKYEFTGTRNVAQDGTILADYNRDDDEYFRTRNPILQEALKAYGVKGLNGVMPHGYPTTLNLPLLKYGPLHTLAIGSTSEATKVANSQYEEAIPRDLSKLITAKPTDFEAEWSNFQKSLDTKMNLKALEAEMNKLLQQRMKMWYGK